MRGHARALLRKKSARSIWACTVRHLPGGFHVTLIGLKRDLVKGDVVPVTLTVYQSCKTGRTIEVKAEVRDMKSGYITK